MRLKSLVALLLAVALIFTFVACGNSSEPAVDNPSSDTISSSEPPPPPTYLNTLTGEMSLLDKDATTKKPVAVTINNVRVAQQVQCGLDRADVVFETEVEGGITRLLALFADPSDLPKLGTIRSLRVVFADIAAGMDALLFYHGIDEDYCLPHLKTLGIFSHQLGYKTDSFREKNGLAYEHRLYTTGEMIDGVIESKKPKTEGSGKTWLNFSETSEKAAPSADSAINITVPFSGASTTQFIYDETEMKYARARKDVEYVDALSGNRELFTNLFILQTTITNYDDNYHKNVSLEGGNGYYASAGGIIPIKWSKGSSKSNFKFTLADGTPLTVNQGNSYVCIVSKSRKISYEGKSVEEPDSSAASNQTAQ
ncbi:MAG: DUF3048 domain-containing protein [Clostridia bacterium]|nr:DUF3048 domain-containing protein [Clostridia bacterium]